MLCMVGFTARLGFQMDRTPVLPLFAEELAADVWLIGLIVGASTITGVFLKFPAGPLRPLGRRRILLLGAAFFAFPPFGPVAAEMGSAFGTDRSSRLFADGYRKHNWTFKCG